MTGSKGSGMASRKSDSAQAIIPAHASLKTLRAAAAECRGCDLWKRATQTVFGEGKRDAPIMFVGEQPGDQEDIAGLPFVGPAGRLLDECLERAGLDRAKVYVTNTVKHFKWEPRGKRRLHSKPVQSEIAACRPWLDAEIDALKPRAIVCLGATAARTLLGKAFRVSVDRGRFIDSPLAELVMATVHPSSILRARDSETRHAETERLASELRVLAKRLSENGSNSGKTTIRES